MSKAPCISKGTLYRRGRLQDLDRALEKKVKKVLLVDDDPHYVKLVKESLEEEGYFVQCAYNGRSALTAAQGWKPDVILMDVNMPFLDGLKTFRHLRAETETSQIPVIFISELVSQVIYPVVETAQRVAHIKKPIDLVDLSSLLRLFFQRYAA